MPALLGPPPDDELDLESLVAVTMIVWPASVMTEGEAVVVPEEEPLELELEPDEEPSPLPLSTSSEMPSNDTDHVFFPPPVHALVHRLAFGVEGLTRRLVKTLAR